MEDYYKILGVNENASSSEIKKAYRSLQMQYHPDKNLGNEECLKITQQINEAYDVLGDEQKRKEYDLMRNSPFMRMNGINQSKVNIDLNDMLNIIRGFHGSGVHIFHGGNFTGGGSIQKPIPIITTVQISLSQVYTGVSIPLEIERWILENGNKVFEKETIYVDIHQGIDNGEMIILREKGNIINESCKGDIKINVVVNNDTIFQRQGLDLILIKSISLKEALCGFSFEINHLSGKSFTLNNNKGSIVPPEYKKSYNALGLKRGAHTGNLIIHFHVLFPDKLTDEQIDKLIEIL